VRIYETCTYSIYLPSSPTMSYVWTNPAAIKEWVIGEQGGPLWVWPRFKSPDSNGASDIIVMYMSCWALSVTPPVFCPSEYVLSSISF